LDQAEASLQRFADAQIVRINSISVFPTLIAQSA